MASGPEEGKCRLERSGRDPHVLREGAAVRGQLRSGEGKIPFPGLSHSDNTEDIF